MIYTVTLNPSIDYIVRLDSLVPGITNRTTAEEYYYGGKGINVSCVLAELDLESTAFGFVAGFTGDAIEKGIRNDRIITDFIKLESGISRINIKIKAGVETEINCQGPHISEGELERLFSKIDRISDGDTIVIAGNIPNTMPDDVYERILERIKGKDVRIVVDATKKLLLNALKYKPFLIKPNNFELGELFSVDLHTDEEITVCAKQLQAMGARNVLVSLGGDGALLLGEDGQVYRRQSPNGTLVNSVGAGDSMVAGFLAGFEASKGDLNEALKMGISAGSASAFHEWLATEDDIKEVYAAL
mgnify:CR=1 FL=1